MQRLLLAGLVGLGLMHSPESLAESNTYTLSEGDSKLYVQVFKKRGGAASALAHDHVILATGWSGSVTWDTANIGACSVNISLPVSGLAPDTDTMRNLVGYSSRLSATNQAKVKGNIMSLTQLAVEHFPTITYNSTSCTGSGSAITVTGNLTIRGASKAITVPMEIQADGSSFAAKGTFTATHEDFGFAPYSAMGGALRNETEMRFTVDVKGSAQ